MHRSLSVLASLAAVGILAGCGDSNGSSSGTTPVVSLNLAARAATGTPGLASLAEPYTVTDGAGNSLTFDKVELVLREIELKRADRDVVCGSDDANTDDDSNDDSSDSSASDDCEELEFGPVLLDLPLGPGAARAVAVEVAAGSYDELEFEIHKPEDGDDEDDAADRAFIAAHPDFDGISVRVTGSYNGTPFTYTSDLSVEQEHDLVPPLAVETAQTTDLTLFVDIDSWFRTEGGTLVNPATADDGLIKSTIERSLNAFEDDDPERAITSVDTYVLDRARCVDLPPLFRVPEWTYDIFLNEALARALHDAQTSNLFLHELEVR